MYSCGKVPFKDKGCHFVAGLIISFVCSFFLVSIIPFLIGAVAGLLKEIYDTIHHKKIDSFDIFATILGSAAGVFIYQIGRIILRHI